MNSINQLCSDIISYNSQHGVRTRGQIERSTSSCRMWQLIFAILTNLPEEPEYYDLIKICHEVIERVKQNDVLYSLIYSNEPLSGEIENYDADRTSFELGNNYMCIYIDGCPSTILHYFTVIKTIDNNYYLNSAYKSDYVCVPQYTTVLKLNELNRFVEALNSDEKYTEQFFKKFFLEGNLSAYSDELKFVHINADEGNEKEIAVYTENKYRNRLRCGIITKYNTLIQLCISAYYTRNERVPAGKSVEP